MTSRLVFFALLCLGAATIVSCSGKSNKSALPAQSQTSSIKGPPATSTTQMIPAPKLLQQQLYEYTGKEVCNLGNPPEPSIDVGNGFSLEVMHSKDEIYGCDVTFLNSAGEKVISTSGIGVSLSGATGQDVTGDGVPDIVFTTASGGSGGFADTWIYSIEPKPRLLFATSVFGGSQGEMPPDLPSYRRLGTPYGLSCLRDARDDRVILKAPDASYEDGGAYVLFELKAGRAIDPPDESKYYDQDIANRTDILGRAFDYLNSGRPEMAWAALAEQQTASDSAHIKTKMLDAYCHYGVRKQLGLPLVQDCGAESQPTNSQ